MSRVIVQGFGLVSRVIVHFFLLVILVGVDAVFSDDGAGVSVDDHGVLCVDEDEDSVACPGSADC